MDNELDVVDAYGEISDNARSEVEGRSPADYTVCCTDLQAISADSYGFVSFTCLRTELFLRSFLECKITSILPRFIFISNLHKQEKRPFL